jgi:hypothetical protein
MNSCKSNCNIEDLIFSDIQNELLY